MELIHLSELKIRYCKSCSYSIPEEALLLQLQGRGNPFERILDNQVLQHMDEIFSKAAFEGVLKFKGTASTAGQAQLNPMQDIPQEYFRVTRSFIGNKILGYSDSHGATLWPQTLQSNLLHPDYAEVLVDTNGLNDFLSKQPHFAFELKGISATAPSDEKLTLSEAISFLAFGIAVEKAKICEFLDPTFRDRQRLLTDCLNEVRPDSKYDGFPRVLSAELYDLDKELTDFQNCGELPPSGIALQSLARRQSEKSYLDGVQIAKAESALLNAARTGQIKLSGVSELNLIPKQIPTESFYASLSANWLFDELLPKDLIDIINGSTWKHVFIDGDSFRRWLLSFGSVEKQSNVNSGHFANQNNFSSQIVANRPATQRIAATNFLNSIAPESRKDKLIFLVQEMKQRTGLVVSTDTMRRARKVLAEA